MLPKFMHNKNLELYNVYFSTFCIYPLLTVLRYGYATNTRMKFVIITENTTSQSRDNDINPVSLSLVYNLYCHPLLLSLSHTYITYSHICSYLRKFTQLMWICSVILFMSQTVKSLQSKFRRHHTVNGFVEIG